MPVYRVTRNCTDTLGYHRREGERVEDWPEGVRVPLWFERLEDPPGEEEPEKSRRIRRSER